MINVGCFRSCLLSLIALRYQLLSQMEGDMHPGGFLLNKPINDLMIWESKRGRWTLPDFLGIALQDKGRAEGRVGHREKTLPDFQNHFVMRFSFVFLNF